MSELRKMGVRLTAEGVNQYKEDLRSAGKEARLMSQETKIAMLELGTGASAADRFQTNLKGLSSEYDVQRNKLKTLSNAQKQYTSSLNLIEREITDTSSALKTSQNETSRLEKEYRELARTTSNSAIETNKAKQAWQDSSGTLKTNQNETNRLEKEYRELSKTLGSNATETKKAKQAWEESATALKKSQNETNRLEKEYRELSKASGMNATETKKAKQAWQDSKQETKELATNLNQLEKEQSQYTKELDKMPGKINAAKISMGELSNEMQQLNREYILNGGHLADASQKLTDAGGKIKTFSSGMQSVGSTLTTSLTLPIVAAGTAALMTGIQFEQQMSRVGAIAGATGEDLAALTAQAKDLGASTAFSAGEVAQGMENMASAGFTVTEIMGSMSGVLDLAAVSGGDVALASEAMSTALNAFGLEASDAGHVANVFARAAADTNAETADMAEALKYAAPPAANLGMSLEDTAAAIGIMSDAGIKGSQAGTTLRGAMTRLAKPTKQSAELMAKLGLEMFDAQGNIKPMSGVVSELENGLNGMTREQKAAALATIFGQEAMSGMMTLIEAGPGKVDELSKSFENSAGSAEEMAKVMQDNVAGTIDEMMGALETAGIELTEALAPAIRDIAEVVTELVGSFNELDDETQRQIIAWVAAAAAAGPLLSVIGSMGQGVGTLMQLGGGLTRIIGGVKAATGESIPIFDSAGKVIGNMGTSAANAGGAKGVGGLIGVLSKLGPVGWGIVGAGGLLAAGYGAWKLFGEEAYNSGERVKQWGTDVGVTIDGQLDKMQTLTQSTSGQFTNLANGLTTNKEQMSGDFIELGQTIESSLNERITKLDELMSNLPETVKSTLTALLSEDKKRAEESLKIVEDNNKKIQEINDNAAKNNREKTIYDNKRILDLNRESAEAYVNTLQISQKERETILNAMNGDVENSTKQQASTWAKSLAEQRQEMKIHGTKQKEEYLAALEDLGYSDTAIAEQAKIWDKANEATTNGIDQQLATIAKKYPEIAKEISFANGQTIDSMGELGQEQINENERIIRRASLLSDQLANTAEENSRQLSWMADDAIQGAETWNNLVFDENTGVLKTNVREEVINAGKDATTWNEMRFQLHNANLNSNAKSIIGESAIVNGWWDGMAWEDKAIILNDEFSQTIYKALEESGKWNEMSVEEKTAIMYSNTPEKMTETLGYLGLWDEYEAEIKKVDADNSGFIQSIMNSEEKMNYWRSIPDETKEILGENYDLLETIFRSEEAYNNFKSLSDEEKVFLGENSDLMSAVLQSKESYNNWVSMPDDQKQLLANNKDLMAKVFSSQSSYNDWMRMPDTLKKIKASTNVPGVSQQSIGALNKVPGLKYTEILATTNAGSIATAAQRAINNVRGKTVTILTEYKTSGSPPAGAGVGGRAIGDPHFHGGPVWLGDGGRREPYLTPSGRFGVSDSDYQLHTLEKGTRIWPSRQAFKTSARYDSSLKQYLNMIPKFAKGGTIENPYDGYTGLVGEAGPEIFRIAQGKVSITPISNGQRTKVLDSQNAKGDNNTEDLLMQMLEQNNKMLQLIAADRNVSVNVNGKNIATETSSYMVDEMTKMLNKKGKRGWA